MSDLNVEQVRALRLLDAALVAATDCGLLDHMQPYCNEADSINDVCDAVEKNLKEVGVDT